MDKIPGPTIDEVLQGLALMPRHLDLSLRDYTAKQPQDFFNAIRKTISIIDKPSIPQKPPRSELYLQQWSNFLAGEIPALDKLAIKYLCWESEAVEHPEFCRCLVKNAGALPARAIKGLVATIHQNWHKDAHAEPFVYFTVAELSRYSGKDRTIAKWKSGLQMLLGKDAAAHFARNVLLDSLMNMKSATELWAINEDSAYMRYSAVNAASQALEQIETREGVAAYVLRDLLYWSGWRVNAEGFRFMVNKLILHSKAHLYAEELRVRILNHPMLGDPRLPANKNKWLAIDADAKKCFISWLSKEDIKFFFDSVLEGHDPHGRRNFWLKYVERVVTSRPFLSEATAYPFRSNRNVSFGRLSGGQNKAAFIMDFGEIIAVEFSEVGMIYLYMRDEFTRYVPDIWTSHPVNEGRLKNQGIPSNRKIRHKAIAKIVYVDWRDDAATVLSQNGIRPWHG